MTNLPAHLILQTLEHDLYELFGLVLFLLTVFEGVFDIRNGSKDRSGSFTSAVLPIYEPQHLHAS